MLEVTSDMYIYKLFYLLDLTNYLLYIYYYYGESLYDTRRYINIIMHVNVYHVGTYVCLLVDLGGGRIIHTIEYLLLGQNWGKSKPGLINWATFYPDDSPRVCGNGISCGRSRRQNK